MNIGDIIREIKYVSRLNQLELAELLGCKQASISRLKNNKQFPSLKMAQKIVKLAKKYKIKVDINDFVPME